MTAALLLLGLMGTIFFCRDANFQMPSRACRTTLQVVGPGTVASPALGVCRSRASGGISLQGPSEDMSRAMLPFVSDGLGPRFSCTGTHLCKHTHIHTHTHTHTHTLTLPVQALRSSLFIMSGGMLPSPVTTVINDNVQT